MRRRFMSLSRPNLALATAAFALLSLPAQAATPAAPQVNSENLMKAMQNSLDSAGTGVDAPIAAPAINAPAASSAAVPPIVDVPAMAPPPTPTMAPVPVAPPVQAAPIDTSAPKIVEPLKKDSYVAPTAVAPTPAPAPIAEAPTPTAPVADAPIAAPPGTDGVLVHEQKASESSPSPTINAPTKPEPVKTESAAAAPAESKPASSEPAKTDSNAPPLLSDMNEAPKMLDNAANSGKQDLFVPAEEKQPAPPVVSEKPPETPASEMIVAPVAEAPVKPGVTPEPAPVVAASHNAAEYNAPYSSTRSLFGGPGGASRQGVVAKPTPAIYRPKPVVKPATLPPETEGQVLYSQAATDADAKPEVTPAVDTSAKEADAPKAEAAEEKADLISPPAKEIEAGTSKVLYSQPAEEAKSDAKPVEAPTSTGKSTNFNKK